MALVSVMEVQTMAAGDAMVKLRCLAMFAMPARDRAAKQGTMCVKCQNSDGVTISRQIKCKFNRKLTRDILNVEFKLHT